MASPKSYRTGAILLFAASVASLLLAAYAYFTPLTGVTGTAGAMLVIVASLILALAALVLPGLKGRGSRNALRVLILLGLIGTAFAGWLLHLWLVPVAMAIGLIGLIIDMTRPASAAPVTATEG